MSFWGLVEVFGRGGGGGSGGGSDGGGSVLILVGFGLSTLFGKIIKKIFSRKPELIISAAGAAVASVALLFVGLADSDLFFVMVQIVIGIWAGWGTTFFGVWDKLGNKAKKAEKKLKEAAAVDSAWDEEKLLAMARERFLQYQSDWSNFNVNSIKTYATEYYTWHAWLMLRTLKELGRVNTMEDVKIDGVLIVDVQDAQDSSQDRFTVAFNAKAKDSLVDTASNKVLFTDKKPFVEYWDFVRNGDGWLLNGISQEKEDANALSGQVRNFATQNGMYYSPDMGWLFLPKNGVLFKGGTFGKSDINNHVVGVRSENLVQMYTYKRLPEAQESLVVTQINLPKSYGGIIVRKKKFLSKKPKGYERFEFEWGEFNKRYEVLATSVDSLPTFELLNPAFMAYLYDTDPKVTIEVADNVVYLYKPERQATLANYETMMTILKKVYEELKM